MLYWYREIVRDQGDADVHDESHVLVFICVNCSGRGEGREVSQDAWGHRGQGGEVQTVQGLWGAADPVTGRKKRGARIKFLLV